MKKKKKTGSLWQDQTSSKYIIVLWVVFISLIQQLAHITQKSRGRWWWPHFTNTLGILMGAAWNIYRVISPDADQSLLAFIRSVVQSYLHVDESVLSPSFWKTKVVVHDSNQLTGHSHWPTTREKQWRYSLPGGSGRVRTFCDECDVALCIKEHFKSFHSRKWYHLYICCSCSYDAEKYISIWWQSFYSFSCGPHPYQTVPYSVAHLGPLGLRLYVQDSSYRPVAMTLYKIYNCSTPYQNQKIPERVYSYLRRFSNLPLY